MWRISYEFFVKQSKDDVFRVLKSKLTASAQNWNNTCQMHASYCEWLGHNHTHSIKDPSNTFTCGHPKSLQKQITQLWEVGIYNQIIFFFFNAKIKLGHALTIWHVFIWACSHEPLICNFTYICRLGDIHILAHLILVKILVC